MDKLKLLVVDDELGMRLGAVKTLKNFIVTLDDFDKTVGFDTSQAESGEAAWAELAKDDFDLLLLDYKLPDISGLDILSRLRETDDDVLTIMMTAYASLEVAVSATKNGAYDFLAKPFTPQELKNVVQKAARSLLLKRQAKRLAEEKKQVRFQFLSVLSHELKAPLNAIEGYLNIMRDRTCGDDLSSYEQMVDRSIIRIDGMRKLIFDLLDLTRIESGRKTREIAQVDLIEAARTAIENVTPDADKREIKVHLNAPETVPVHADRGELEIIFNNLVSNAVKYNKDGGRVDISVTRDEGVVTISVADTGIGMSEEDRKNLFGEFVRIKNQKTRNITGSGLGLSILKRLAGLYHGDVNVESEVDKGSVFTVTLRDADPSEASN